MKKREYTPPKLYRNLLAGITEAGKTVVFHVEHSFTPCSAATGHGIPNPFTGTACAPGNTNRYFNVAS
jgi:hypothetical protein